jgi:hypothetical protein
VPSRSTSVKLSLSLWPIAFAGCVVLTLIRLAACHPDAASQGNAWTEDHNGYCTNSGWDALTAGPGSGSLLALILLAVTVAWPATVLACGTAVAAGRGDAGLAPRAYAWAAAVGGALIVAFILKWGHATVVGGAGG